MKIHLFKIEQFFDEQLVLNAELQYPFVAIEMNNVGSNKIKFLINDTESQLTLDNSHEYITQMSCSCDNTKDNNFCIHLVMAAWEFRKKGFPKSKTYQTGSSSIQVSTIINAMEDRSLRQFLTGYAARNKEFNLVLKLLFSHEVTHSMPYESIKKQLYNLYELFRTSLDTKKHQKTFEFYLRTYLGVAEDLITKKNFRSGGFYALSSWELWMDKRHQMDKLPAAKNNYEQVIKVLGRIERSPISPELYKYIFKTIAQKLQNEDTHPILEYDIPELLVEWDELTEEEYEHLILRKITQARSAEYWITRFMDHIDQYSSEQLNFAKQYIEKLSIDKLIRKLEGAESKLGERSFFFIIELKGHRTKNDILRLEHLMLEDFNFLVELHLLSKYGEKDKIKSVLYDHEYSDAAIIALQNYLATQKVDSWIQFLIRHHVFDQEDAFDHLEKIEDPKEWIQLLSHLKPAQRKIVLEKIQSYCLEFASNHLGLRARKHLQSIGQMLTKYGFQAEWSQIRDEIINKFDHRKSIQSMENPFL